MINLKDVSVNIGNLNLLDSADLFVGNGQKCGIVGPNGTGKTTLFKAILGEIDYFGKIELPKDTRVVAVSQHVGNLDLPVIDYVLAADKERTKLLADLENPNTSPEQMGDIYDRLISIDAYTADARAVNVLKGLGFDEDMQLCPLSSFSGGWQMRVALASALFVPSDVLMLDEPTNHLDFEATTWLQDYLKTYNGTILLISHDRDFLDTVCDHIVHLSGKKLELYKGNYSTFLKTRAMKMDLLAKNAAKIEEKRKHLQAFVDRFRAKATKAKQAQSRVKMLAKLDEVAMLPKDQETVFHFPKVTDIAPPLFKIEKAKAGYGEKVVLRNINFMLNPGDRIAILGKNGNGKSTLAKVIADKMPIMDGEIFKSNKLKVGYFAQNVMDDLIDKKETPFAHINRLLIKSGKNFGRKDVLSYLAKFGIVACAETVCQSLSGGQQARLALAMICLDEPNLLILDEPTNHLDVDARDALADAIDEYGGTVIIITHDFHLIESVADELWLVDNHQVKSFDGDLNDYRNFLLKK